MMELSSEANLSILEAVKAIGNGLTKTRPVREVDQPYSSSWNTVR